MAACASALAFACSTPGGGAESEPTRVEGETAQEEGASEDTAPADARVEAGEASALEMRELNAGEVPDELEYEGELVQAIAWSDAHGDNWVLFSEMDRPHDEEGEASANLYVAHYVRGDGPPRRLRLVRDRVEACTVDVTLRFEPEARSVTDLDEDGIGEVTFAYWIACKGDVSPDGLKLLMLEGGDKYIIRGRGHWADCPPEVLDDEPDCHDHKSIDPSLENGPAAFRDHALAVWAQISPQRL
jgi:hypothetical protein